MKILKFSDKSIYELSCAKCTFPNFSGLVTVATNLANELVGFFQLDRKLKVTPFSLFHIFIKFLCKNYLRLIKMNKLKMLNKKFKTDNNV